MHPIAHRHPLSSARISGRRFSFQVKLAVLVGLTVVSGSAAVAQPATDHPRLWVRSSDLPALRSWATAANPVYDQGLRLLAEQAKADMDAGLLPGSDSGGNTWEQYPNEMYAELFAFMHSPSPDTTVYEEASRIGEVYQPAWTVPP